MKVWIIAKWKKQSQWCSRHNFLEVPNILTLTAVTDVIKRVCLVHNRLLCLHSRQCEIFAITFFGEKLALFGSVGGKYEKKRENHWLRYSQTAAYYGSGTEFHGGTGRLVSPNFWTRATLLFLIYFLDSCSNHCLAALDLGRDVEQPFDCLIVQNRQAVQFMRRSIRWIGHLRTTWSTVCSSAPHSLAAEEAIPHLYKQERKRPTLMRRRLSRTQALLGRVIPGGGCQCRGWKCGVLWGCPNTSHSIGNPPTYDVVVRWTDEMLCSRCRWVSRRVTQYSLSSTIFYD